MSRPNVHGLPQFLRKDEKGYFLDYNMREGGRRNRKRVRLGHIPLEKARRILGQHMQAIIEGELLAPERPKISFDDAADAFLAYSESRKKSFKQDRMYVRNLRSFFGDLPLEKMNLDSVESYLNWRRKEGNYHWKELSGTTLNRDLACLKTIVRRAVLNRQIDRNPLEGFKLFKEIPRDRTLTPVEFQTLLSHCIQHLKPMVFLAYRVGMRRGEILNLRRNQVDYQNRIIILEAADTKTQDRREIPMDDEMIDVLRRVPRVLGSPYFFTYRGKPIRDFKTGFRNACEMAGLKGFHFHDLRHCSVTNMRKAGVPEGVIMSIHGHKTNAVFRRYDQVDRGDRMDALHKMKRFREENRTPAASEAKGQ